MEKLETVTEEWRGETYAMLRTIRRHFGRSISFGGPRGGPPGGNPGGGPRCSGGLTGLEVDETLLDCFSSSIFTIDNRTQGSIGNPRTCCVL